MSLVPRRCRCAAAALLLATTGAGPATGQLLQDARTIVVPPEPPITTARSIFDRSHETGVADRMLPAFSSQGTQVGDFDVFAGLSIGGLSTSNVLADNANQHGDLAVVVRPQVTVRTSAGPYQISVYGLGDVRRYVRYSSEDTEEGLGGVQGSVAIGPLSSVSAGMRYGSLIDPRYASDSPQNAAKPLEYDALDAYASGKIEGASTRLILRADLTRLRFHETPSTDGGTLVTRDRDRVRYDGLIRLERALSPALSIYGAASANKIDYRFAEFDTTSRDSKGYGLYVGSSFEATALLRGDVRIGYIRQDFDLARTRPISGLGALGALVYFPNGLWTITATGESSVQDSGVPGSGGFLHRGGSLRTDNELRRYLIASIEGGYFRDSYRGLNRRDTLPYVDAGLTYLSHDHWNARLGYRFIARSCKCTSGVTDLDDHRISATMTFQN